jgi:hypothetical protein
MSAEDFDAFSDLDVPDNKKVLAKSTPKSPSASSKGAQPTPTKPGSQPNKPGMKPGAEPQGLTYAMVRENLKTCFYYGKVFFASVFFIRVAPFVIHAGSMGLSKYILGNE